MVPIVLSVYTGLVTAPPDDRPPDAVSETDDANPDALLDLWRELMTYRADYGLGYSRTWVGLSHLSRPDRVLRLLARPAAQEILTRLATLDEAALGHLETIATINAQRAHYALRTTSILNLSGPVAVIVALGQLFPKEFKAFTGSLDERQLFSGYMVALAVLILLSVLYTWLRSRDAAELRELIIIASSRARNLSIPPRS